MLRPTLGAAGRIVERLWKLRRREHYEKIYLAHQVRKVWRLCACPTSSVGSAYPCGLSPANCGLKEEGG